MEKYLEELFNGVEFDNSILLVEESECYLLMVEDKEQKQRAIDIIEHGGVVDDFGCGIDLTQEQFEHFKSMGYTIVEL